jgi:dienelactone hydrolase
MSRPTPFPVYHAFVEQIPVIWVNPEQAQSAHLAIWLPGLTGSKDQMVPFLQELARAGFVALSFDPYQHGERGSETAQQLGSRVFGNFRHWMWPILGQSALDALLVIDWAFAHFQSMLLPSVAIGGISMGGDISVVVAALNRRIKCVSAIIATPDWLRPGMQDLSRPGTLLPPGEPGAYANFFYTHLNPLTHVPAYSHRPALTFECGADDIHVPSDGALRFQQALYAVDPDYAERLRVNLHAQVGHEVTEKMWRNSLDWFLSHMLL